MTTTFTLPPTTHQSTTATHHPSGSEAYDKIPYDTTRYGSSSNLPRSLSFIRQPQPLPLSYCVHAHTLSLSSDSLWPLMALAPSGEWRAPPWRRTQIAKVGGIEIMGIVGACRLVPRYCALLSDRLLCSIVASTSHVHIIFIAHPSDNPIYIFSVFFVLCPRHIGFQQ